MIPPDILNEVAAKVRSGEATAYAEARRLQLDYHRLRRALLRIGVTARSKTQRSTAPRLTIRTARIQTRAATGQSSRSIASKLGISHQRVKAVADAATIAANHEPKD